MSLTLCRRRRLVLMHRLRAGPRTPTSFAVTGGADAALMVTFLFIALRDRSQIRTGSVFRNIGNTTQ